MIKFKIILLFAIDVRVAFSRNVGSRPVETKRIGVTVATPSKDPKTQITREWEPNGHHARKAACNSPATKRGQPTAGTTVSTERCSFRLGLLPAPLPQRPAAARRRVRRRRWHQLPAMRLRRGSLHLPANAQRAPQPVLALPYMLHRRTSFLLPCRRGSSSRGRRARRRRSGSCCSCARPDGGPTGGPVSQQPRRLR